MFQVAPSIWQEIAKRPEMKSQDLRYLFSLEGDEQLQELERRAELLQQAGVSPHVVSAYQQFFPLLLEHEAIQAYIRETGSLALMNALPDLETVEETISMARLDVPLNSQEVKQLRHLLRQEPVSKIPAK